MSILQDYEKIRKSIGEEKYNNIEQYLKEHIELFLSDIYYRESEWNKFEKWESEYKNYNPAAKLCRRKVT